MFFTTYWTMTPCSLRDTHLLYRPQFLLYLVCLFYLFHLFRAIIFIFFTYIVDRIIRYTYASLFLLLLSYVVRLIIQLFGFVDCFYRPSFELMLFCNLLLFLFGSHVAICGPLAFLLGPLNITHFSSDTILWHFFSAGLTLWPGSVKGWVLACEMEHCRFNLHLVALSMTLHAS